MSHVVTDERVGGTLRVRLMAFGALAALALLLGAGGSTPPADASDLGDKPIFENNPVRITDRESPVAFLGYGEDGLSYVNETDLGTAANAFGYNPSLVDATRLAEASPYRDAALQASEDIELLDAAVTDFWNDEVTSGEEPPNAVASIQISRPNDFNPWRANLVGEQRNGFDELFRSWSFGDEEASGGGSPGMPGEPVGVELLRPSGVSRGVLHVVFATTEGVYAYEVTNRPTSASVDLVGKLEGYKDADDNALTPVALSHDPGIEAEGIIDLGDSKASEHVLVAWRGPTFNADGEQDGERVADLTLLDALQGDDPSEVVDLEPVLELSGAADPGLAIEPGATVQIEHSVAVASDAGRRRVVVGVQADDWMDAYLGEIDNDFDQGRVDFERMEDDPDYGNVGSSCLGAGDGLIGSGDRPPSFDLVAFTFSGESAYFKEPRPGDLYVAMLCASKVGLPDQGNVSLYLEGSFNFGNFNEPLPELSSFQRIERNISAPPADEPGGEQFYSDPQVHLTLPCSESIRIAGAPEPREDDSCDSFEDRQRWVGATILAAQSDDPGASRAEAETTALLGATPFTDDGPADLDWEQYWGLRLPDTDGDHAVRHLERLPSLPVDMTVELPDDRCVINDGETLAAAEAACDPAIEVVRPVPVAVLAAPPYVAGAGQQPSIPPAFGTTDSETASEDSTTATRVGASVGVNWSSPSGMHGAGFEVSYEREAAREESTFTTTTLTQSFSGLAEQDAIVYNATTMWALTGMVLEDSTGLGVGGETQIRQPRSSVMTSSSVERLAREHPNPYGDGLPLGEGLREILSHEPGDPGSYLSYYGGSGPAGASVDEVCIGSRTESPDVGSGVTPNPFTQEEAPLDTDVPAVLVSPNFQVLAGTPNAETASVSIDSGTEQSYLATHSVDATVTGQAFYVTASASAGGSWGSGWTYSVSEGTSFDGSVGHIPSAELDDETYEWRMFVCKQELGQRPGFRGSLPVWVVNYTVDGYQGSGGLSLGPIEAVAPVESATADREPQLVWRQDEGTIERFDWELEAIGAPDSRTGSVEYASMEEGLNPGRVEADVVGDGDPLLPEQTYRWRVTATDFFGNTTGTAYEYFVTAGPPDAEFTWTPSTPQAGEDFVIFTGPKATDDTTYSWDIDGTQKEGRLVSTTFNDAGLRPVTLTVATANGEATRTVEVGVRASVQANDYATPQDTRLDVDASDGLLDGSVGGEGVERVDDPLNGDIRVAGDGAFNYTPDPGFCGDDAFRFRVLAGDGVDGVLEWAVLTVMCVPDAVPDEFAGDEDTTLEVGAPGVLANDVHEHDVNGDSVLTAVLEEAPEHAAQDEDGQPLFSLEADGSFSYTPENGFCGEDTFTYRAADAETYDEYDEEVTSEPVEVVLDIACAPSPPPSPPSPPQPTESDETEVAPQIVVRAPRDETTSIDLGPDYPDAEPDSFVLVGEPTRATVTLEPDGAAEVTPDEGFCGGASFAYQVTLDDGTVAEGTVVLEVDCVDLDLLRVLGGSSAIDQSVVDALVGNTGREAHRLAGGDRYLTSIATAREAWPAGADTVLVATGQAFPDGLAGGAAAQRDDAPLVLTPSDRLLAATSDLLVDFEPSQVVLLGGEAAIAPEVAEAIEAATGVVPDRIGGADRYETAALLAERAWADGADTVYLATGATFPDALAGAAAAAAEDAPVLLSAPGSLPAATADALARLAPDRVVMLGGEQALSASVADAVTELTGITPDRVFGPDRYATASAIAREVWADGPVTVYLATGTVFADALSGAAAAGRRQAPVLLSLPDDLPTSSRATLRSLLD